MVREKDTGNIYLIIFQYSIVDFFFFNLTLFYQQERQKIYNLGLIFLTKKWGTNELQESMRAGLHTEFQLDCFCFFSPTNR